MNKPVGGRGKKAPYKTTILRVPDPLLEQFQNDIENYRQAVLNGNITENTPILATDRICPSIKNKDEIIELAEAILKQKKSARVSLTKLLQVLCNDNSIKL